MTLDRETERALTDLEDAVLAAEDACVFIATDLENAGYSRALIAKFFHAEAAKYE